MNQRIKDIADQCYYDDNVRPDGSRISEQEFIIFDKQKFAELIVRECIAQCEYVANDADEMSKSDFVTDAGRMLHKGMWGGAKNCSGRIKYHFGVETD